MPAISDDDLKALRAKNPRGVKLLTVVPEDAPEGAAGDDFVFRKIDRAAFVKYRALMRRGVMGQGGGDESTMVARELLLHPSVEDFDALRERAPLVTEEFGQTLLEDASAGLAVREGKR